MKLETADTIAVPVPRHRTDDSKGQPHGRPLTIDNDRADLLRMLLHGPVHVVPDYDAFARSDQDSNDPLFDPLEQRGDAR